MAQARDSVHIPAPPDQVMAVLVDFGAWPSFLPWVRGVEVLRHERGEVGEAWEVRFDLLVLRPLRCTLRLERDGAARLRWSLVEGGLQALEGEWTLAASGDGTRADLALDVLAGFYVPANVLGSLRERELPQALGRIRDRVTGPR